MADLKARLDEVRATLDLAEVFDEVAASSMGCCTEYARATE